jgi:oligopeptide/dipeptide ABC transporter ATP-binding protein
MTSPVLAIQDLRVRFATHDGEVIAVDGVSIEVREGECVGVVGESGSGKSQTFLAAMGLLAANGRVEGSAKFRGRELIGLTRKALNEVRGAKVGMIFQDPLTSLTPHMKVGDQLKETLAVHKNLRGEAAEKRCLDWLERVRVPEAKRRLGQYPHQLSGGLRQRVMIAMAMLNDPDLLIADEPTTALDVTVQSQVLDIMEELKTDLGAAIVLITHDMGVVARLADRVHVMKDGRYVEEGDADAIFHAPKTDYAKMLLEAAPRIDQPDRPGRPRLAPPPGEAAPTVLSVEDARVWFPVATGGGLFPKRRPFKAVDGVSFTLKAGETLGVVGESGCGKSTLVRAALQLIPPTSGSVAWLGRDVGALNREEIRRGRKDFQIVFQDPLASLDPRMTIGASIAEPLLTFQPGLDAKAREAKAREMMTRVELDPTLINRYPHELSGGQNQRVGIARAMINRPKVVVCDEAVSALDVSVQAQILKLLLELQRDFGLSMIFISHALSVVREVSHRVMVLYLGRVVEFADRDAIYSDARHPYTKALIAAAPVPDPRVEKRRPRMKLTGDLPSPMDTRSQLRFLKSKMVDDPNAEQIRPALIEVAPGHWVAEHDPAGV